MTNEYLLLKDQEFREQARQNRLEDHVHGTLPPNDFQHFLLHSPEMQAHIQHTHNGKDITFFSDLEQRLTASSEQTNQQDKIFYNRQPSPSPLQDNHDIPLFSQQEYSTGKSIPLTCTCGQTVQISLGSTIISSYIPRELAKGTENSIYGDARRLMNTTSQGSSYSA